VGEWDLEGMFAVLLIEGIMELKFHWRLLQGGERSAITRTTGSSETSTGLPDLEAQIDFCRKAEEAGIHGLLTDFGASKPDSILLATALGLATTKIEFIIAYRSGLIMPTSFVQQLNTLSSLIGGRLSLNIVAGHSPEEQAYYGDFLPREQRYARTAEFLELCLALWRRKGPVTYDGQFYRTKDTRLGTPYVANQRACPEIFIAGGSDEAQELAKRCGTLWMRMGDIPENLRVSNQRVLAAGKEVGLRMAVIARPTHAEAVRAAHELVATLDRSLQEREKEAEFVKKSDSVSIKAIYQMADKDEWPASYLWRGAVRTHGPATVCLVGSPEELACVFMEYKKVGITQFILSGWPKLEEMAYFGTHVLPIVREKERALDKEQASNYAEYTAG
jgi:alkanesulfonate monooxygenase